MDRRMRWAWALAVFMSLFGIGGIVVGIYLIASRAEFPTLAAIVMIVGGVIYQGVVVVMLRDIKRLTRQLQSADKWVAETWQAERKTDLR